MLLFQREIAIQYANEGIVGVTKFLKAIFVKEATKDMTTLITKGNGPNLSLTKLFKITNEVYSAEQHLIIEAIQKFLKQK